MPVAQLRSLIADPSSWQFLPGAQEVRSAEGEVELVIRGPRRVWVRLQVQATDLGVSAELVEGDLKSLSVICEVTESPGGAQISLTLDLEAPFVLPGALMAELEQVTLTRWLEAIPA